MGPVRCVIHSESTLATKLLAVVIATDTIVDFPKISGHEKSSCSQYGGTAI
jgi:hypothetical protein